MLQILHGLKHAVTSRLQSDDEYICCCNGSKISKPGVIYIYITTELYMYKDLLVLPGGCFAI